MKPYLSKDLLDFAVSLEALDAHRRQQNSLSHEDENQEELQESGEDDK